MFAAALHSIGLGTLGAPGAWPKSISMPLYYMISKTDKPCINTVLWRSSAWSAQSLKSCPDTMHQHSRIASYACRAAWDILSYKDCQTPSTPGSVTSKMTYCLPRLRISGLMLEMLTNMSCKSCTCRPGPCMHNNVLPRLSANVASVCQLRVLRTTVVRRYLQASVLLAST